MATLYPVSSVLHDSKKLQFYLTQTLTFSIHSMLSTYFVAADPRVVSTVNFAPYGHGLYFCNATEVQKFSISAAFVKQGRF